jgi:hypothetical protein
MKPITFLTATLCTGLLLGCGGTTPTQPNTDDPRACAQNFSYSGSFIAGRTYKTFAQVKGVTKETAMSRVAQFTVNDGWQVNSVDKDMGIISASQTVSYGEGKTAPLNMTFLPEAESVKLSINYSTSGGVSSPLEAIVDHFCKTIEAARQ